MKCAYCAAENPEGNKYCGNCGSPIRPELDQLKSYVSSQISIEVDRAIESRFQQQQVVEIRTAQNVATRLQRWATLFGWAVGVPLAILALTLGGLGITTYADFRGRVTKALGEVEEQGSKVSSRANEVLTHADKVDKKLAKLTPRVEKVEEGNRSLRNLTKFQGAEIVEIKEQNQKLHELARLQSAQIDQLKQMRRLLETRGEELQKIVELQAKKIELLEQRLDQEEK